MAAWRYTDFNLTGVQEPERVSGIRVSADLFSLLGVAPALGRGFRAEEDRPGGARVAIIGHDLWQRRFGGRPDILGSTLMLDGEGT